MRSQLRLTFMHLPSVTKCMRIIRRGATPCPMSFAHRCPCSKTCLNCSAIKPLSARAGRRTIFSARLQPPAAAKATSASSQRETGIRFSLRTTALRCFLPVLRWGRRLPMCMTRPPLWRNTVLLRRRLFRLRRCRAIQAIIFRAFRASGQKQRLI